MSVRLSVEDHVAVIELDNPGRRNAIDLNVAASLIEACDEVDHDPHVGGVVIQGAGGYFCSGGDRRVLTRSSQAPLDRQNYDDISALYRSFTRVGELTVPTVAAVRGGAVGAGLNLALAADVRVVAADAVLAPGFLDIGLHPGGGHLHLLSRLAGPQAAAAVGVMGATVDGRGAVRLGLAWEAVDDADVEPKSIELVRRVASDPDLARQAKRSLMLEAHAPSSGGWPAAVEIERVAQLWSFARLADRSARPESPALAHKEVDSE